MVRSFRHSSLLLLLPLIFLLSHCGGGGSGNGQDGGSSSTNFGCDGSCAHHALSSTDVRHILQQGVAGAQLLGVSATFAVVDRVGNVLAVYRMAGAPQTTTLDGGLGSSGGLEGISVPATIAAISKAGTGAYLSSQGNAFSTRTASQIVQENFDPGEANQPGGPLFGVQFSQFLCGDVMVLDSGASGGIGHSVALASSGMIGPRPLPLGLSADPGGIPLYVEGDVVGGLGVEFDGKYTADLDISNTDDSPEEKVALYASLGFEAPGERTAPNVSVGRFLRYTDVTYNDLSALPSTLPELDPKGITTVALFFAGTIRSGVPFGVGASGIQEAVRAGVPSAYLVDDSGAARFPTHSGSAQSGIELTSAEVDAILDSALVTAHRARAAIRTPLDTSARVSIWVVDHLGNPLGFTRSQDAPVFGIDVALQKARTVTFMSSPDTASTLSQGGFGGYVGAAKSLMGSSILTGANAFSARAIGNLARPFFPDGINGDPPGPFSLPFPGPGITGHTWSVLNTGLQLDLSLGNLAYSLGLAGPVTAIPNTCPNQAVFGGRLANGLQIFSGGVPLYRGSTLIGGIGISGDGIFQDDLIAFYGASRQGLDFVGHTGIGDAHYGFNAPSEIRSDLIPINVNDVRLRYVNCPEAPFSGSDVQNVCDGL